MRFCNGVYRIDYHNASETKRTCMEGVGCGGINCPANKHYAMRELMEDVALFHNHVDAPVKVDPTVPSDDRVVLRGALIEEEFTEVMDSMFKDYDPTLHADHWMVREPVDLVKLADGLADLIYVLVGTALEFGIPLDKVWNEVQRSNMEKVRDGVKRRADGKILKPDNWKGPDIEKALGYVECNEFLCLPERNPSHYASGRHLPVKGAK